MTALQVKCINKIPRANPHEGITTIGGDGWKYSRAQAVQFIKDEVHSFYTLVNGKQAWIGVAEGPTAPYLRTHADGQWTDNLLALPECRAV